MRLWKRGPADKVFVTLADDSKNTLSNTSEFVAIDDNSIDAVIFSKEDLTVNGSGELEVNAVYGHGIVSKDDLVIAGGEYHINAQKQALSGKDSVRIADGTLKLTAGSDGLHSENTEDEEKGFIYVADGDINITCDSDGFDAEETLQIENGTIQIAAGDGTTPDTSTEDSTQQETMPQKPDSANDDQTPPEMPDNSTDKKETAQKPDKRPTRDNSFDRKDGGGKGGGFGQANDANIIQINGGTLCVDAGGDGIDSNGSLSVTGGMVYVYGPTNSGNGALDYAGTATISGGTFVAVGASGMAQNFGTDSTQGSMLVTVSDTMAEGELSLTDSDGNVLVSCTPSKAYNSVVISCPELTEGETYTLTTGDDTTTITMDSLIYDSDGNMRSGGGFHQNGRGNMDDTL